MEVVRRKKFRRATVMVATEDFILHGRAYTAGSTVLVREDDLPSVQTSCRPVQHRGLWTDKAVHTEVLREGVR